jgi:hypothetical protein
VRSESAVQFVTDCPDPQYSCITPSIQSLEN